MQDSDKNAVIEIIPGAGGREAGLWADDVHGMLAHYAQRLGFSVQEFGHLHGSSHMIVQGSGAYGVFQYEAGIHEVQRTPTTDRYGRIHSSTASVVVLPEADESEYDLRGEDLRMESYKGAGGLHPGITITHLPTGIEVSAQASQDMAANIRSAQRLLRSRLYHLERDKAKHGISLKRKSLRASGQRAERIRTYNFKEGRVRDHRSGCKSMQLRQIMDGNLEQFTVAMREREVKG